MVAILLWFAACCKCFAMVFLVVAVVLPGSWCSRGFCGCGYCIASVFQVVAMLLGSCYAVQAVSRLLVKSKE